MTGPNFAPAEFQDRLQRAQSLMDSAGLGALLLTTEPEVRYFTGYLTRFWESPTRPWYLVVPRSGKPIAVIPSIGAALMEKTWIDDIRTWSAPAPQDDGVSLLIDTLQEIGGPVGIPSGHETHLRMPLADYARLCARLATTHDHQIMQTLRMVKSAAEIQLIETACQIAGRAFARLPQIAAAGTPLADVFRGFQNLCLSEGADWVPYLAGGAGPGGYDDVISPATEAPLKNGDVLMLDTGLVHSGYFCDFDRNWSVGPASEKTHAAYARLIEATQAGLEAAKPGATASEVFRAMDNIVGSGDAGRLGHGLGMQLTEWPSLISDDHTELKPGMVLTLEPGIQTTQGRIMVHEENIVITQEGARMISPAAPNELPQI